MLSVFDVGMELRSMTDWQYRLDTSALYNTVIEMFFIPPHVISRSKSHRLGDVSERFFDAGYPRSIFI